MKLSVISIGNELLNGKTINSNASVIGRECSSIGLTPQRILTVSDDKTSLNAAFDLCRADSDIVICSGGLGPTEDDLTRQIVADYFSDVLELNETELEKITARFKQFGRELTELNKGQARYPRQAKLFNNNFGTASAFLMRKEHTSFFFLPGVPYEMTHLLIEQIIPYLKNEFNLHGQTDYLLFRMANVPESILNEWLAPLIAKFEELEFAFYPNFMLVDVYVRGRAKLLAECEPELGRILGEKCYSRSESADIIDVIVAQLLAEGAKVTFAESCTGGLLASAFVAKAGVSSVFSGSFVVYSNEAKQADVAVNAETLENRGAVSEECVSEMALGAAKRSQSQYAVAISGIAGPSGGSEEKPVGTVCFAVALPAGVVTKTRMLGTQRKLVQNRAVSYALFLLWQSLKK